MWMKGDGETKEIRRKRESLAERRKSGERQKSTPWQSLKLHSFTQKDRVRSGRLAPALASCWSGPTWDRLHRNRASPPLPLRFSPPKPPQVLIRARQCLLLSSLAPSSISPSLPGLTVNHNPGQTHSWLPSAPTVR